MDPFEALLCFLGTLVLIVVLGLTYTVGYDDAQSHILGDCDHYGQAVVAKRTLICPTPKVGAQED